MLGSYPIDFEKLRKGDVIPVEIIEEAMGKSRDEKEFGLSRMSLGSLIEKHTGFNVAYPGYYEIRILTDSESIEQGRKSRDAGVRAISLRAPEIFRRIDVAKLTDNERERLQNEILITGYFKQAMRRARRLIRSGPENESVPPRRLDDLEIGE